MASDEVGCNTEEPRSSISPRTVIASPSLEGDGEGLGSEIRGQISTDPSRDVAVDFGKMSIGNLTELIGVAFGRLDQLGVCQCRLVDPHATLLSANRFWVPTIWRFVESSSGSPFTSKVSHSVPLCPSRRDEKPS